MQLTAQKVFSAIKLKCIISDKTKIHQKMKKARHKTWRAYSQMESAVSIYLDFVLGKVGEDGSNMGATFLEHDLSNL